MTPTVAVLPGDGVGPEVTRAALRVLEACLPVGTREAPVGGAALESTGDPLPAETLALCRESDAVLLGAVGGPRWEDAPVRPEKGLLRLRRELGVFANLRPSRYLGLPTPLREGLARHADILVVRELSSGVYFGEPRELGEDEAVNTWRVTAEEVRRVAEVAFDLARKRRRHVCSVDKANVLETSRLWRRVVTEVAADYPDVQLVHRHVDVASFDILRVPQSFDVILTDNLFGDILSDEAAAVSGAIGVLPSAALGSGPGLFEPVHGPAADLAGQGVVNPVGAILTVGLMLEHAFGRPRIARAIESAVVAALRERRTPDLGGKATTDQVTDAVLRHLEWSRWSADSEEEAAQADWGV
ncbi:MAG: 3-isopropylmalate dehydrogenase [Acidobacteria bacterium]|jgi:3-isopropylmalate dehydrogenase|nr:3-isopropylmalate dehydrogenase [Acidobacteriota bacterium]